MPSRTKNTLFYGDNLDILREHFDAECVDLIYLDPPFHQGKASYEAALAAVNATKTGKGEQKTAT